MWRKISAFPALVLAVGLLALVVGCNRSGTGTPPAEGGASPAVKLQEAGHPGEHAHKPGAHGGNVVEIGSDNYHAEAIFEKGGTVKLYILGKDEARVQEVEKQDLQAYVKAEGGTESLPFTLRPMPQSGDGEGKTSQFVGTLPKDIAGPKLEVTVPSITINGERFHFAFASSEVPHEEPPLAKVSGDAERMLYLTPGGKYTADDIKANGNMTASEKYKGAMASHNLKPQAGDAICPITLTKASTKFTWVVGGQTYEFCCPPCIDEFVQAAKERPDEIKDPRDYLKK
jgi:hypothetical protein